MRNQIDINSFKKVVILVFLGICFVSETFASISPDTLHIQALNEQAWELRNAHPDSAINLANEALGLAEKDSFQNGIQTSHSYLGTFLRNLGWYDKALLHYEKCLAIRASNPDSCYYSSAIRNIAVTYRRMGRADIAMPLFLQVLGIRERNCGELEKGKVLQSIGNFYGEEGQHRQALSHHQQAQQIFFFAGEEELQIVALRNIAIDYQQMGIRDSATLFYREAIKLAKKFPDDADEGMILVNYSAFLIDQGRIKEANQYLQQALDLFEADDRFDAMGDAWFNLGLVYQENNQFSLARDAFLNARDGYFKAGALQSELDSYKELADLPTQSGKSAIPPGYVRRALILSDSLNQAAKAQSLSAYMAYYQDQQKSDSLNIAQQKTTIAEAQSELLLNEAQSLSTQRNALLATAIGILLIAILIWLLLRSRLQTTRLKAVQREAETRENIAMLIRQGEAQVFHAMFEGKEQERLRIATDLHDNLGSLLSTVKLYFSALESRLADLPPDSRDHLTTATRLMDDAVGEVRRIAHDLVNGTLVKVGLVAALEEMGRTIAQTGQTDVEVLSHGIHKRLDQETEIALFRVVQELLNNTLRHAAAEHVTIQLNRLDGLLSLMVEDDGKGFDPAKTSGRNGLGLQSVRNRVTGLGGTVNFDSQPGRGTTVVIEIPIAESMANGQ